MILKITLWSRYHTHLNSIALENKCWLNICPGCHGIEQEDCGQTMLCLLALHHAPPSPALHSGSTYISDAYSNFCLRPFCSLDLAFFPVTRSHLSHEVAIVLCLLTGEFSYSSLDIFLPLGLVLVCPAFTMPHPPQSFLLFFICLRRLYFISSPTVRKLNFISIIYWFPLKLCKVNGKCRVNQ